MEVDNKMKNKVAPRFREEKMLRLDGVLLTEYETIPEIVKRFMHEINLVPKIPVILDFAGTSEICSKGINAAIALYKQCIKDNRSFSVEIADQRLWNLFMALKLDTKIEFKRV